MTTAPTLSPWTKDLVRRIQFSYGGHEAIWLQVVNAYFAAGPIWILNGATREDVGFDHEWEFNETILDGIATEDGEPVTAGELIENYRLWDFLAAECAN